MIQELSDIIFDKPTAGCLGIPSEALSVFNQARASVARKTLSNECCAIAGEAVKTHCENRLTSLSVQGKFNYICQLEAQNQVWNRIMDGLQAGQLSSLLRAGSDTLPTPLNLKRWNFRVDAKCDLCLLLFFTF